MVNSRKSNGSGAARQHTSNGEARVRGTPPHRSLGNISSTWTAELPLRRSFAGRGSPRLTLQQEAMNTDRHHRSWASDSRFRDSPVSFTSGGAYNANDTISIHNQDKGEEEEAHSGGAPCVAPGTSGGLGSVATPAATEPETPNDRGAEMITTTGYHPGTQNVEEVALPDDQPLFVVDVNGSTPDTTKHVPPQYRSSSPTPSCSSDEIIVFTGRSNAAAGYNNERGTVLAGQTLTSPRSEAAQVEPRGQEASKVPTKISRHVAVVSNVMVIDDPLAAPDTDVPDAIAGSHDHPIDAQKAPRHRRPRYRTRRKKKAGLVKSDDEILDDYVANLHEHGKADVFNKVSVTGHELAGSNFAVVVEKRASVEMASTAKDGEEAGWGSAELQDLLDLSTSDEVLGRIQSILAKRTRTRSRGTSGGVQYLVVWEGYTTDDAKWVEVSSLTMDGAAEQIRQFEEKYQRELDEAFEDEEDDKDSSEEEEEAEPNKMDHSLDDDWSNSDGSEGDTDDEEERLKDNEDLLQRRVDRMTDEKIARILAKQEELGLGSNDILLFDGDDEEEAAAEGDNIGRKTRSGKIYNSEGRPGKHQKSPRVPDAVAEDEGLDDMEWEGPRARRKGKDRKRDPQFELSDSELEADLRAAWEVDRAKKKVRKQERQELRAQGLLGGGKKAKAKAKQQSSAQTVHVDLVRIKREIRTFVLSSEQSIALPPMDIVNRKIVHEVANAYMLKSKSAGHFSERFTTLYKTRRSAMLDESGMDMIERALEKRGFLRGMQRRSAAGGRKKINKDGRGGRARPGGGGSNMAAASYRDGDVVGAAAPEIGSDNRGRAMLEKMGWSTGTALGALDNKGILHPVEHIVKTSKTGLG